MGEEEVKSLWRDVREIKASLALMDKNIRESFDKLPCTEMGQRVAKAEQRLDNGAQNQASSRVWVGLVAGWALTLLGLAIALFLAYKK